MWLYSTAIKCSANIEENPGLKPNSSDNLILYAPQETYLDSSISSVDYNLKLPGYNLVCADNPITTKKGGTIIILYSWN